MPFLNIDSLKTNNLRAESNWILRLYKLMSIAIFAHFWGKIVVEKIF